MRCWPPSLDAMTNTKTHKTTIQTLKPPKQDLLDEINTLQLDFQLPPFLGDSPALTQEAALRILVEHPITTWRKEVVAGLPTYWFCTPVVSRQTIVSINELPSNTSREDVILFAKQSLILSSLIFSINRATHSLYTAAQSLPEDARASMAPVLSESITAAAKSLKVNRSHLSTSVNKMKGQA